MKHHRGYAPAASMTSMTTGTRKQLYGVSSWLIFVTLAYIMVRPVSNNQILMPAVAMLFMAALGLLWVRGRVSLGHLITIGLVVVVGIYGLFMGLANPGLVNGALVWIVAPIIFGTFAAAGDEVILRRVLWISALTTVLTSLFVIIYVGGASNVIPDLFPSSITSRMGAAFDSITAGSTDVTLYSLSTLVAAVPMWLTATLLPRSRLLPPKWLSATAGVLGLAATLSSGRAALIVVVAVVPVLVWLTWRVVTRRTPRTRWRNLAPIGAAAVAAGLLAVLMAVSSVVGHTWQRVSGTFTGDYATIDDQIRGEEAAHMLDAWRTSPVFGHGWGATIEGYSRNEARPWNFELQYHLILFQVGLVGAFVLLLAVAVAMWGLVSAARMRPETLPVILVAVGGAGSMLIANASNPYLQAPGNMWPVYLLLMVINVNVMAGAVRKRAGREAPTVSGRLEGFLTKTVSLPNSWRRLS